MSIFYCESCGNQRDADIHGCTDLNGEMACDDCYGAAEEDANEYEQEQRDTARTLGEGE